MQIAWVNFYNYLTLTDSCITVLDVQFYGYKLVSLHKAVSLCIVKEPIGKMHIDY